MPDTVINHEAWLEELMEAAEVELWGAAELAGFSTPLDDSGHGFPRAISWAIPMNPHIMFDIQGGPNQAYADEYTRVNNRINELSKKFSSEIQGRGFRAKPLAASERTDEVNIRGDFPHKTAATRAGLGWIGRHCQLITRRFGSWVRLGTVFTDMELKCGPPTERNYCGDCLRCVEACPANALTGAAWSPGTRRHEILDVTACDQWKKKHYYQFHRGHNCGICSAVCPYGLKVMKKKSF